MLVHMFTLLHLMQKRGEQKNARGRKHIDRSKRSLITTTEIQIMMTQLHVWEERTSRPHLRGLRFALSCEQSCQVNHEGTVRHVSKSRINVIIWPITL